jgi:hypothetical protein
MRFVRPSAFAHWGKVLVLLFAFALGLRLYGLGLIGLSSDELNKLEASVSYRHGYFSVNNEHPMMLKVMVTGCVIAAEKLNSYLHGHWPDKLWLQISPEAAVRFPAAVFGAATAVALVYLGSLLFTPALGLCAGFLWASDINIISINRVAKEETLAVFFLVLTVYFFMRGKDRPEHSKEARRDYLLGGVSAGLLMGAWYLIIILLPLMVYYSVLQHRKDGWRIDRLLGLKILLIVIGTFLISNPNVLSPENIAHMKDYFLHRGITHHGYFMLGKVFPNKAYYTLWGVPPYFYFLYLAIKFPIITLTAFLAGLCALLFKRDRNDKDLLLLIWFVTWSLLLMMPGGKFVRYILTLMPVFVLIVAYGVLRAVGYLYRTLYRRPHPQYLYAVPLATVMAFTYVFSPLAIVFNQFPHYGLFLNEIGSGFSRPGSVFPHCEYYDAGVRESMQYLCRVAPRGAVVASEVVELCHFYSSYFGRKDLRFVRLSQILAARVGRREKVDLDYYLVQDGRKYFENVRQFEYLQRFRKPVFEYSIQGGTAVAVYRGDRQTNERIYNLPSVRPQDVWTLFEGTVYEPGRF